MRTNLIDNRQIRVFISSTFRDMQDERDYLMKRTFPKLRKLAAERDVTLTELDLRWGITEEEAKSGKVVEICLREIENSIPFFIGIIGNRYGWVPEKNDLSANVTERFPDVNTFIGQHLSVTEMEMQFGVLQREEDMHAYFYIKEGEDKEKPDNPEMLERLKEEVEASRYPSSTYSSPENLAEQVEQAFIALLDQLFPKGNISELEKERIGQRSFMHQLCQNYIRDDKNFQVLDDWMQDWEQHQMVITGPSGLGKSALIANWVNEKQQDKERDYNIIYHFTGNGGSESSHEQIMKVLIDEIYDVYGWESEKELNKSQEDKLNEQFIRVASEGKKPLLIVLDAINQIIDRDNAKLLNWLPFPPKNIKILFSTLEDDRTMEVIKNRHYPSFVLQPISLYHRKQLISEYLHLYGKKLKDRQIERIANDSQCENTLVLKTLLDELVNFGIYEKLDERIEYYLSQDTIEKFYQALLKSYEEEFGKELIKHILSLVAVSRNGLNEDEITSIIKCNPINWSQFYCSFLSHLITKNGLIAFSHDNIRHAVQYRYIKNKKWEKQCCNEIISYFEKLGGILSFEELAYQYNKTKNFASLYKLLTSIRVFSYFYREDEYGLSVYWHNLISAGYRYEDFRSILLAAGLEEKDSYLDIIDFSIKNMSLYSFSIMLCNDYDEYLKSLNDAPNDNCTILYNCLGNLYNYTDEYDKSLDYHAKALDLRKKMYKASHPDIADTYINMGRVYYNLGQYDLSLDHYRKALSIYMKKLGPESPETAMSFNNIGVVYKETAQYERALEYYNKALFIREKILGKEHPDTAGLYHNIGIVYYEQGDYSTALNYSRKALEVQEKVFGTFHTDTANSYVSIGNAYYSQGDCLEARKYYRKALAIQKKLLGKEHRITATTYNNLGNVYYYQHQYATAIMYYNKSLKIRQTVLGDDKIDTASSYCNIGNVYYNQGKYPLALKFYKKTADIREQVIGKEAHETLIMYYYIADVYFAQKNYEMAGCYYENAAIHEYEPAYNNLAYTHILNGEMNKALPWAIKAVEAYPDDPGTIDTLATVYQGIGRYDEALEQFELCLRLMKEQNASEESIRETEEKIAALKAKI